MSTAGYQYVRRLNPIDQNEDIHVRVLLPGEYTCSVLVLQAFIMESAGSDLKPESNPLLVVVAGPSRPPRWHPLSFDLAPSQLSSHGASHCCCMPSSVQ